MVTDQFMIRPAMATGVQAPCHSWMLASMVDRLKTAVAAVKLAFGVAVADVVGVVSPAHAVGLHSDHTEEHVVTSPDLGFGDRPRLLMPVI